MPGVQLAHAIYSKKTILFSTKSNPTTRENIANIYGVKTISALIPLDLHMTMQPTAPSQVLSDLQASDSDSNIYVSGHVSKPVSGEGRQTPDRQMFFVNGRPCGLPQIAKAFNEVYKSYNITQSPFVFANFRMDTNAYDVNVSPDKRSIMLHDQAALLEKLKESLVQLFESQSQTMPQSQLPSAKLPAYKPLTVHREASTNSSKEETPVTQGREREPTASASTTSASLDPSSAAAAPAELVSKFASRGVCERAEARQRSPIRNGPSKDKQNLAKSFANGARRVSNESEEGTFAGADADEDELAPIHHIQSRIIQDFNDRLASQQESRIPREDDADVEVSPEKPLSGLKQTANSLTPHGSSSGAPNRHDVSANGWGAPSPTSNRPILDTSQPSTKRRRLNSQDASTTPAKPSQMTLFAAKVRAFGAPGTQIQDDDAAAADENDLVSANSGQDQDHESAASLEANQVYEAEYLSEPCSEHASGRDDNDDDSDYVDAGTEKKNEALRIQKLVEEAEESAMRPSQDNEKRAARILKSSNPKDSTVSLVTSINTSIKNIGKGLAALIDILQQSINKQSGDETNDAETDEDGTKMSAEDRLSLTIQKSDFGNMRIVGQFNLGFILAVRSSSLQQAPSSQANRTSRDDLFIIDQHASDEIYNFHRLTASTSLTAQPLVQAQTLGLTAIEEELAIAHAHASLAKNGFKIEIDDSGDAPVGHRVKLLTLPTSKETVFTTRDLEELLALLVDIPEPPPPLPDDDDDNEDGWDASSVAVAPSHNIVRPSKVRKMLAMRACRSSIMVGKTLSHGGMARVVRHMGEIDRPWNCPHGRPTMRHLAGLESWSSWQEGEALEEEAVNEWASSDGAGTDWQAWVHSVRQNRNSGEDYSPELANDDMYDEYADEGGEGVEVDEE